jgi:hypothetical protein
LYFVEIFCLKEAVIAAPARRFYGQWADPVCGAKSNSFGRKRFSWMNAGIGAVEVKAGWFCDTATNETAPGKGDRACSHGYEKRMNWNWIWKLHRRCGVQPGDSNSTKPKGMGQNADDDSGSPAVLQSAECTPLTAVVAMDMD